MEFAVGRTRVKIGFSFAAALTVLLLLDSNGTCALALAACILHECGHLVCMLAFGERPYAVHFSFYGMRIETDGEPPHGLWALMIFLGGPAFNMIASGVLWILGHKTGAKTELGAQVNLVLGAFNLLPCLPLDAGRALQELFCFFCDPNKASLCIRRITGVMILPLFAAGLYVFFRYNRNFSLLTAAVYVAVAYFMKE